MESSDANLVVVGKITSAYGIKGWVKVFSYTDPINNITGYQPWYVRQRGGWNCYKVSESRPHGKFMVAQLEGVSDRNEAELLKGQEIAVPRDLLPETEAGEYYWIDLEGLQVVTTAGDELGKVDHVMETGANDVLVVQGDKEHLIPYVMDIYIHDIDIEKGLITVDWDPDY